MVIGKSFYAVHKGFKPGVYLSWEECKAQVEKSKGATFKKFSTRAEAEDFVAMGYGQVGRAVTSPTAPPRNDAVPSPPEPPSFRNAHCGLAATRNQGFAA